MGLVKELSLSKEEVCKTAETVMSEKGMKIDYKVGTMIELPRAAIVADQIAQEADFFSFGTNDLTQTTFGFSRDDVSKFVPIYQKAGILEHDPFAVLDQEGVGEIMKIGIQKGRSVKPKLKMGICVITSYSIHYTKLYDQFMRSQHKRTARSQPPDPEIGV